MLERRQRWERRFKRQLDWLFLFPVILLCPLAGVDAQTSSGQLLTVSKPPASLLPTDPAQGLVYASPPDLAAAEVSFDAAGGPVSLVYLVLDAQGTGYLTFDDGPNEGAPGGVMVIQELQTRAERTFDPERDRLLTGSKVGLSEPKDLELVADLGLLIVADFGAADLKVFDLKVFDALGSGNISPRFTVSELGRAAGGDPRRPWGLAYDPAADRLFVGATDGALLVYDSFLLDHGEDGPTRVVVPMFNGQAVSHNLHELVYLADTDTVVVTDVGAATTSDQPGFDSDGALFLVKNAGEMSGPTPVSLWLHGPDSLLGNPVSVAARGDNVFVGENGLDLLLRFDGLLRRQGEVAVAPDAALSLVKPESVIFLP